jgi:hypothetical protein
MESELSQSYRESVNAIIPYAIYDHFTWLTNVLVSCVEQDGDDGDEEERFEQYAIFPIGYNVLDLHNLSSYVDVVMDDMLTNSGERTLLKTFLDREITTVEMNIQQIPKHVRLSLLPMEVGYHFVPPWWEHEPETWPMTDTTVVVVLHKKHLESPLLR